MRILQLLTIVAVLGTLVPLGHAQDTSSFKTLYNFTGGPDGGEPLAAVVIGAKGALYGTTSSGGTSNQGTVFRLRPPASPGGAWTETAIHAFTGNRPASPYAAGVAIGAGGVLYGTLSTYQDLSGTVFSLTPPASTGGAWTETVLWTFERDHGSRTGLVIGGDGVLYGTTQGFSTSCGPRPCLLSDVFSLTPPASAGSTWTETTLASFIGHCGAYPQAALVIGSSGVLYGTSNSIANQNEAYSLTPPLSPGGSWTVTELYGLMDNHCFAYPQAALVIGSGGVLYDTTVYGGTSNRGNVYSLTPPTSQGGTWTEAVLWNFTGGSDGANPQSGLVIGRGGVLYGTTLGGGASNAGTVFSLTPPATPGGAWTATVLHSFTGGPDGGSPVAGLAIGKNGVLYGTTSSGGTFSAGTVFALRP